MAFTEPQKLLFPAARFTKADLIRYYLEAAPVLLPHLRGRPVTLKRFPGGVRGEAFYEKDAPGFTPEWVPTFPVPRREGGEPIRYILVEDARTLAWCANAAAIELHPFLHRVPDLTRPTHLAFDLDPGEGAGLQLCAEVAGRVKAVLDRLQLASFPKVSGSKGLQLYVPLHTPTTYTTAQAFARTLAELLHQQHPDLIVSDMAKSLRRGRVFIDWSQNADFKTTVAVYSVRAKRDTPFVSMPLTWAEVRALERGAPEEKVTFDPGAALARIRRRGDLFAPVLTLRQKLPKQFAALAPSLAPSRGRARKSPRALADYEAKRDFARTAEPAPELPRRSAQGSRRRFVIQKHAASHLHYDLRLEISDTLKSWAVPKGLPTAAGVRHSAFPTEDHPLAYLSFEGVIPAGQYGGGTVMVWDIGTFEVIEGNVWKGFLRVFLRGRKLRGEWTLTRAAAAGERERWVVEQTGEPVRPVSAGREDVSAISGRSMAEIAAARDAVWASNRASPDVAEPASERGGVRPRSPPAASRRASPSATPRKGSRARSEPGLGPAPAFVPPMLARLTTELPQGPEWTYEVKWDGYRALAIKHGGAVDLRSRKDNSLAKDFPSVVAALRGLPAATAVLDGEIVALDEHGRPQFQALQHRRGADPARIVFYAYDLLRLEEEDLRAEPLAARKARLERLVAGTDVRFSASLPGEPAEILAQASRLGLEGIVAKRRESRYESGERSGAWLKLKLSPEQEFVIGGYKPGHPVESLCVGYYVDGQLHFAGKVRQGLDPALRRELGRKLAPLRVATCPFVNLPNSRKSHFGEGVTAEQMKELRWVKPRLVAQVSFTEWTRGGNLRHATFKGLRDDKPPRSVIRET